MNAASRISATSSRPRNAIAPNLQRDQLIVLESTTYPGTTEELVLPILEKGGLRCPIAPGRAAKMSRRISISHFRPSAKIPATSNSAWRRFPRVVGGINPAERTRGRGHVRADRLERRSGKFAREPRKWSSCSKISSAA